MREFYGDQYDTAAAGGDDPLIPGKLRQVAGAVVFLGLIAVMGLWAYRLGTRDAAEVPIVRAIAGPARVAPADPGGTVAAHQGLEVNVVLAGRPAPEPAVREVPPAPQPLRPEDSAQAELAARAPAPEAAPRAAPEVVATAAGPEPAIADLSPEPETAALSPETVDLTPFTLEPEFDAEAVGEAFEPSEVVGAGPRPRGRPEGLRPAAVPAFVAARVPASETVSVRVVSSEPPAAPSPPAAMAAAPNAGARLVQLGAFDSAADTQDAWERLVGQHADLLGSKSLFVERTTANARVFYRLRVAGFGDTEATRRMCEDLRARGVDCIPVTLN